MMSARNAFRLLGFLGMLGLAAGAQAQWEEEATEAEADYNPEEGDVSSTEPAQEGTGGGKSPVAVTVGAKLGIGGNYLPEPDNRPAVSLPFDDGVGGIGFGGGIFAEARVLDNLLGLELGFIFDSSNNWSKYTFNGVDYEPGWTALDLRMPLLLNVGTPGDGTRVSFGTGPEFAFPLSASSEITGPNFSATGVARTETHVNWLLNLGLDMPVGPIKITFDLRFAYNLGVPSDYAERVSGGLADVSVLTQHAMDLRLMLGVGYDLPL